MGFERCYSWSPDWIQKLQKLESQVENPGKAAHVRKSFRVWKMLQDEYLLAHIGLETVENETSKIWKHGQNFEKLHGCSEKMCTLLDLCVSCSEKWIAWPKSAFFGFSAASVPAGFEVARTCGRTVDSRAFGFSTWGTSPSNTRNTAARRCPEVRSVCRFTEPFRGSTLRRAGAPDPSSHLEAGTKVKRARKRSGPTNGRAKINRRRNVPES